jgi:hypothetical protein
MIYKLTVGGDEDIIDTFSFHSYEIMCEFIKIYMEHHDKADFRVFELSAEGE